METFHALLARVNFPHKGQWRGALVFSLICAWINASVNNREAGDLRRYRAHFGVTIMKGKCVMIDVEILINHLHNTFATLDRNITLFTILYLVELFTICASIWTHLNFMEYHFIIIQIPWTDKVANLWNLPGQIRHDEYPTVRLLTRQRRVS